MIKKNDNYPFYSIILKGAEAETYIKELILGEWQEIPLPSEKDVLLKKNIEENNNE